MANDLEKRFHSIMDKLFHSSPSPPGTGMGRQEQLLGAKKCPNPTYSLAAEKNQHGLAASESPLCRPWDRGDFLRRLSTFKSMTWFTKPKVVNVVNYAMRGWVNVDRDILAYESYGALENVASMFSLKLDSGHKLTCPWIDNVCDERLVEFPPTVPADLIDKFLARPNSLFQVMALLVISSSAIEFMRNGFAVDSANLYYQAQKLISLCGWEPCPLPYVVNFKDGQNQFVKDAETLSSPQGYDPKYVVCARDDNFKDVTPLEGTSIAATEISPYADNDRSYNIAVKDSDTTHIGESSIMIQGANVSPRNEGTKDNDSSVMIISEQCHPEQLA
ncbi:putative serine-threonine protein kinase, plant-type [Hibiscus syriacus]|uniref:Serine-threonine protein kinase, plant-type n=1 Tax=Hibiscus syriacus TaxID=106335 RepID=A0A6A3D0G3_HIBSY|nr:putative serine-threonine protein kinase, plant-type [Hibiscus syriacus]